VEFSSLQDDGPFPAATTLMQLDIILFGPVAMTSLSLSVYLSLCVLHKVRKRRRRMACYEIMIFPMEGNPGVYNLMHHLYVSV
jgi:hypothetical protein